MSPKIGLVTPSPHSHRTAEETIGIGYLGAVLRNAGYNVCIVDGWLESLSPDNIVAKLSSDGRSPDIVGISCYRSNINEAVRILELSRKNFGNIPIIAGGFGPTFHDEFFINKGFTVVVRGDAEHIIAPLVQSLLSREISGIRRIPGVTYIHDGQICRNQRSSPIENLDTIPFPSRDTVVHAINQGNFIHVCTSRGCEAHCNFCSIFSFAEGQPSKKRWRYRSIENIVEELRYLYEQFGIRHFKFVDDSFFEPPRDADWAKRFRDEIRKNSLFIKFRTQIRADRITQAMCRALKEAGWFGTSVGVENFAPTALRRMAKSATVTENLNALQILHSEGVYIQMGLIMFDPYTTLSELKENLRVLRALSWPVTKGIFSEMYAAEGTVFTRKLVRSGLLREDSIMQNHTYDIADPKASRVYCMLKQWHRSHSSVYDWVIDSLTAPKVLPYETYAQVHGLYGKLRELDLQFFEHAINRTEQIHSEEGDIDFVDSLINKCSSIYTQIREQIAVIYVQNNLRYQAEQNPFLGK